ncbi:cytoplasmic protein, partial [Salmonella enterica subsp. enterica serovar Typhimurium]|nr:cytoplasmic protein [Salmonella enterica subsp. enterica serovar Typhimurium]
CEETWTQTLGGTEFGGTVWRLRTYRENTTS